MKINTKEVRDIVSILDDVVKEYKKEHSAPPHHDMVQPLLASLAQFCPTPHIIILDA